MAACRRSIWFVVSLACMACSASLVACAGGVVRERSVKSSSNEIVITEEKIRTSGASTAWDAIRRTAGHYLKLFERRGGVPARIERRGQTSIYLNDSPVVFLDGIRLPDLRDLVLIPASEIESIVILTGIDGTTYYGTNAVNGVILISTKT